MKLTKSKLIQLVKEEWSKHIDSHALVEQSALSALADPAADQSRRDKRKKAADQDNIEKLKKAAYDQNVSDEERKEALRVFQQAKLKQDPTRSYLKKDSDKTSREKAKEQFERGMGYIQVKKFTKGINHLMMAYNYSPHKDTAYNIAQALHDKGDEKGAAVWYTKAGEKPPKPKSRGWRNTKRTLEYAASGKGYIRRGHRGEGVKEIQRALGFTGDDVDGKFGGNTEKAVIAFQKNMFGKGNAAFEGTKGIVGPETGSALLEGGFGESYGQPAMSNGVPWWEDTTPNDRLVRNGKPTSWAELNQEKQKSPDVKECQPIPEQIGAWSCKPKQEKKPTSTAAEPRQPGDTRQPGESYEDQFQRQKAEIAARKKEKKHGSYEDHVRRQDAEVAARKKAEKESDQSSQPKRDSEEWLNKYINEAKKFKIIKIQKK